MNICGQWDNNRRKQLQKNVSNYRVNTTRKYGPREERKAARLQVSMGIEKHTGEKFLTLCEWSARRFDQTTVIVSDSLQRHNLMYLEDIGMEEAYNKARAIGDQWIEDNKDALELLGNSGRITRWDDWLVHPDFKRNLLEIHQKYRENRHFRRALNIRIYHMWAQKHESDPVTYPEERKQRYFEQSLNYLLEEAAIFPIMTEEYAIDVYAGTWFSKFFDALKEDVSDRLRNIIDKSMCYEIDFVKRKSNAQPYPVA